MTVVYLLIRRKQSTIFMAANDNTLVLELKHMIENIINVSVDNQQLHFKNEIMDENKTLLRNNVKSTNVLKPAMIGLAVKMDHGYFEQLDIHPYQPEVELLEGSDDDDS